MRWSQRGSGDHDIRAEGLSLIRPSLQEQEWVGHIHTHTHTHTHTNAYSLFLSLLKKLNWFPLKVHFLIFSHFLTTDAHACFLCCVGQMPTAAETVGDLRWLRVHAIIYLRTAGRKSPQFAETCKVTVPERPTPVQMTFNWYCHAINTDEGSRTLYRSRGEIAQRSMIKMLNHSENIPRTTIGRQK